MTRAPLDSVRRAGVLIITANRRQPWTTYLVASIPGWIVAGIVALLLHRLAGVPALAAIAVLVVWMATDITMYPRMRRYYTSEPASRRIVGVTGTTVSPVAPRGFARVHGELWQVTAADEDRSIPEGASVRVRDIRGLMLLVEPTDHPAE